MKACRFLHYGHGGGAVTAGDCPCRAVLWGSGVWGDIAKELLPQPMVGILRCRMIDEG